MVVVVVLLLIAGVVMLVLLLVHVMLLRVVVFRPCVGVLSLGRVPREIAASTLEGLPRGGGF